MGTNFRCINLFAKLDAGIVDQAKSDLLKVSDRNCLQAALYFFLDGEGVDEKFPKTFTHLCSRNGIDPERAAKGIWNQLNLEQQSRVLKFLEEVGFKRSQIVN